MRHNKSILIVAIVIALAFATVVISSTLSGGDSAAQHTMPGGGTMQGESMP